MRRQRTLIKTLDNCCSLRAAVPCSGTVSLRRRRPASGTSTVTFIGHAFSFEYPIFAHTSFLTDAAAAPRWLSGTLSSAMVAWVAHEVPSPHTPQRSMGRGQQVPPAVTSPGASQHVPACEWRGFMWVLVERL